MNQSIIIEAQKPKQIFHNVTPAPSPKRCSSTSCASNSRISSEATNMFSIEPSAYSNTEAIKQKRHFTPINININNEKSFLSSPGSTINNDRNVEQTN